MATTFDYTQTAKDAEAMVNFFGREITFVKFSQEPVDTAKPWRASTTPRSDPEDSVTIKGAFVDPSSSTKLGFTTIKPGLEDRFMQIIIIAPGTEHENVEFERFDEVIDGTVKWKIHRTETLKPGPTRLAYFIEVSR